MLLRTMQHAVVGLIALASAACELEIALSPNANERTPVEVADSAANERLDEWRWPSSDACKATVFVFVASTCPIANGYAPEVNRLHAQYAPRGVRICIVHTEPELTAEQVGQHTADYGHRCRVVVDRKHELVSLAGATVTPEVAVFSPARELLYRGRIDDRFPDIGINRDQPRTTELRDALEAILAGKPVAVARTEAVGCLIESAPK